MRDTDQALPRGHSSDVARRFGWRLQRALKRTLFHAVIAAVIIVFIFPIWVGVDTSIKPANQLRKFPTSVLTTRPTMEKYAQALGPLKLYRYMGNTVVVAGATTLLGLLVGSPAAFALSRFRFRGRSFFARTVLLDLHVPSDAANYSALSDDDSLEGKGQPLVPYRDRYNLCSAVFDLDAQGLFRHDSARPR